MKTRQTLLDDLQNAQTYIARLLAPENRSPAITQITYALVDWETLVSSIDAQIERIATEEVQETHERLQRWVKTYLTTEARQALNRNLAQRRYAAKQKLKTIQISEIAHIQLSAYAAGRGLTLDEAILSLLDQ